MVTKEKNSNALYQQKHREYLRSVGLCTEGCGRQSVLGKARCARCREKQKIRDERDYIWRQHSGLCVKCGQEAVIGKALCSVCQEKCGLWDRRRYHQRKQDGLCVKCGAKASVGFSRCASCSNKAKLSDKKYHAEHFQALREYDRKRKERRIIEGCCSTCGIPLIEGEGVMCVNCIMASTLRRQGRVR